MSRPHRPRHSSDHTSMHLLTCSATASNGKSATLYTETRLASTAAVLAGLPNEDERPALRPLPPPYPFQQ
eukprot:354141-Chlamydomonas_euryale.AAC.9